MTDELSREMSGGGRRAFREMSDGGFAASRAFAASRSLSPTGSVGSSSAHKRSALKKYAR